MIYGTIAKFDTIGFLLFCVVYFQFNNSRNDLFIATIQICNERFYVCKIILECSNICEATRFAYIVLQYKQEDSWVLGRSPDMTIRKVRGKHNHSPTLQTLLLNVYM